MTSPAGRSVPRFAWILLLVGAAIMAFGIAMQAYFGGENAGRLVVLRVVMVIGTPWIIVYSSFRAGQLYTAGRSTD